MPTLDSCIAGTFVVGNIGADAGTAVTIPIGTLLDPDNYDPDDPSLVYALDFTKFYNAMYAGAI